MEKIGSYASFLGFLKCLMSSHISPVRAPSLARPCMTVRRGPQVALEAMGST